MKNVRIFDDAELIPQAWLNRPTSEYYLFNPAIGCFRDQLIMAYRVVMPDGRRRLALCRLTQDMQVVRESVFPFSDSIRDGGDWHADARFCIFRDRLFVHYNDGFRRNANHIYLVEVDPATLMARGPARSLVLNGPQRVVEKNWMLFAHNDELWAIYSICPHVVLKLTLDDDGPVLCHRVYQQDWNATPYATQFGELRGGAPPVRVNDQYISFFHSSFLAHRLRHFFFRMLCKEPSNTFRYVGGVYGFEAKPPFTPLWLRHVPLSLPSSFPRRHREPLNRRVGSSVYPCGAILQDQRWIISFGVQDEYCCLAIMDIDSIKGKSVIRVQMSTAGAAND